ncbi:YkyA family protein [Virgibacillus sp. 179-BFC.A HS]|uniref:YkyA family protein n=1 Tax=Tigheibacillus jepli TaxID=3035914 RepID=A0ABU5CI31_9BACI|nr:YkyA family protein [Virgibacillus sp. 179-BFC.A HS]MDY0406018.1 YkyA family protein [Virgibacillus sp. 179-BFC.A HS]
MNVKKPIAFIFFGAILFILSACGQSAEEKIYNHLEEAVTLEGDFAKTQGEITKLEDAENKIYDQIIELGMDDFDQIQKLSNEAMDNIAKRSEKLDVEQKSVHDSKTEFVKTKELISKLEKKPRSKADKMYDIMMKRYDAYDRLHKAYTESLKQEKQLYRVLQEKDSKQEGLTKQISKLNGSYEKVIAANKDFNKYTNAYNKAKKDFYKQTDLNVSFETTETAK